MRKFNMSRGRKTIQTKSKSGRREMARGSNLGGKTNVNEEYKEAFRTKSYIDMWSQVNGQINLSEYLLKPREETLDKIESLKFHHLLLNYFESGTEACNLCESILKSIHQTRAYYQKLRRLIKIGNGSKQFSHDQSNLILNELSGFAQLNNPLSTISPLQFRDIHEKNVKLYRKLTSKRQKMTNQAKSRRISKKIGSVCLIITHTTLLITLTALAFHSVVGIIAAPGLTACVINGVRKKKRKPNNLSSSEGLRAQLDISAKGIYILINDFDTISRLFWRLHDEIEHRKAIANMCIRNGKIEVLKEVVKEFSVHDSSFVEQLKELEEHTKLCFHTINRSRRLVIQEIIDAQTNK